MIAITQHQTNMENELTELTPGEHEWLRNRLKDQVQLGRITRIDPESLPWEINSAEYIKLKTLLKLNKFTEVEDMLFSLGAKGTL